MLFESFESTYDAYVHIFFAEHYASHWFDHWNLKWYTGFTVTSYPPLIHQLIALCSKVIGLKGGFILVSLASIMVFIRGVFHFSKLWVPERSAAFASCAAAVCSSYVEAIHIFGQLPSITGIAILLNTLPIIYWWVRRRKWKHFILSLGLMSIITCTHHVTTIFGMVFFIFPIIGLALLDDTFMRDQKYTILGFLNSLKSKIFPLLGFGGCILVITILSIFPYWYWSKSDPISQIPIPHGSRDSFIDVASSGLVFFIIPWGLMLLFLPYLFTNVFKKRNIILGLSLALAFVLGTGGTTPIPRALLGDTAFDILTLDRFTYWATILSLPFWGDFIHTLIEGDFKQYLVHHLHSSGYKILMTILAVLVVSSTIFIMNIGFFRPFQPDKIDVQPIVNFMSRDDHDQWRYLTLGFGDQVAWLAANTDALSIDGNYHSARRLPELTTRVVERLENAKYQGMAGLGALNQFLTIPEKYNLKYIFCNDKFYEPILYFSGWNKVRRLENNIDVWEKPDVAALPDLLPRKNIPHIQQLMWSTIPIGVLSMVLLGLLLLTLFGVSLKEQVDYNILHSTYRWKIHTWWALVILSIILGSMAHNYFTTRKQYSPANVIDSFYNALDFKYFDELYTYYDPITRPEKAQIFLNISLEDGIANSFGKLNTIQKEIEYRSTTEAKAIVSTQWITSMDEYTTREVMHLIKRGSKWYIKAPEHEVKTPPQHIVSTANVNFSKLGRREALVSGTEHSDILDRPDIGVGKTALVEKNGKYYIIGEIMNTDIVPAYITATGVLYSDKGEELLKYNARDHIIHRLAPKEVTSFMIDFEEIANQKCIGEKIDSFNIGDNPFDFLGNITMAKLYVNALVSTEDSYPFYGISEIKESNNSIQGILYNSGNSGVNIPRVLTSFYNPENKLVWIENTYIEREIRPLRSKSFKVNKEYKDVNLVTTIPPSNININGFKDENKPYKHKGLTIQLENGYKVDLKANGYIIK